MGQSDSHPLGPRLAKTANRYFLSYHRTVLRPYLQRSYGICTVLSPYAHPICRISRCIGRRCVRRPCRCTMYAHDTRITQHRPPAKQNGGESRVLPSERRLRVQRTCVALGRFAGAARSARSSPPPLPPSGRDRLRGAGAGFADL
eukprot:440973-Pyramimonas_sp.AAC.1